MNKKRQKELLIDVSNSTNEKNLIESIIRQFDFPNLYERNWSGLTEYLFYDPMMKVPECLSIKGMKLLEQRMPESYVKLNNCLNEYFKNNTNSKLTIEQNST